MGCQELSTTVLLGLARIFRDCIQVGIDLDLAVPRLQAIQAELRQREGEDIAHVLRIERQHLHIVMSDCPASMLQTRARERQVQLTWPLTKLELEHEHWIQRVYQELIQARQPVRVPVLS